MVPTATDPTATFGAPGASLESGDRLTREHAEFVARIRARET